MTKIDLTKEQCLALADAEGDGPVSVGRLPDNCIDCTHHKLVSDPDPTDWFCDDDVAVLCTLAPHVDGAGQRKWSTNQPWPNRAVAWSCRPHYTRTESARPEWCPLLAKK